MKAAELEAVFARIPQLAGRAPNEFTITTLPGYTNRNLRLYDGAQDWVLRVPRASTDRFVDREAEAHNQALACDLGIAPRPAWRDASGLMLTPTLAASRNPAPLDFTAQPAVDALLEPVRRLHRSGAAFRGRVDLAELLNRYYLLLDEPLRHSYRQRLRTAQESLSRLGDRDLEYVPSHNDLVLENLLLEAGQVWLIDWEFSSLASPYWDLATLCNAAALNDAQSVALLQLYCADGPQMEESLLFDYRNLLQLLSDCWMAALA